MTPWISPEEAVDAIKRGRGRGVRIALLDSGVEIGHRAFDGRELRDDFIVEVGREDSFHPGSGFDLYGHGTAVAGIIWQVAPEAEIGSFRILGPNLNARSAQVSLAAHHALKLGYHVLNCSFGCSVMGHLALYKDWIDRAERLGVHVVAASGNHDCNEPEWPAHFSSVLGVDVNHAANKDFVRRQGSAVEFLAPGSNCQVPWKGGESRIMTGSSFAAAYFTGILSRLLSVYPLEDPLLVKALLRRVVDGLRLEDHLPSEAEKQEQ